MMTDFGLNLWQEEIKREEALAKVRERQDALSKLLRNRAGLPEIEDIRLLDDKKRVPNVYILDLTDKSKRILKIYTSKNCTAEILGTQYARRAEVRHARLDFAAEFNQAPFGMPFTVSEFIEHERWKDVIARNTKQGSALVDQAFAHDLVGKVVIEFSKLHAEIEEEPYKLTEEPYEHYRDLIKYFSKTPEQHLACLARIYYFRDKFQKAFEKRPSYHTHNDPHRGNTLIAKSGIHIVDWESFTPKGDAARDLAEIDYDFFWLLADRDEIKGGISEAYSRQDRHFKTRLHFYSARCWLEGLSLGRNIESNERFIEYMETRFNSFRP